MPVSTSGIATMPIWVNLEASTISNVGGYLSGLGQAAANLTAPRINPVFPSPGNAPNMIIPGEPGLRNVSWTTPNPLAPFTYTLNVDGLIPPPFTGVAPTLTFGQAPASFNGIVPASPPIDLNFVYPTVAINLPTPPALYSLSTVAFNPLNIPTFNETVPELTIAAPSLIPYHEGALYTSATLMDVEASLQKALTDGTDTGLPTAIQTAMWDAAREREYRQQADALAELERMETLGFAFPPGVFLDSRIKIQTETNYTIAGLSREIMIKQAELHLENVVKARENAITLEGTLINYANQVAQRAFEAAKYQTEAQISIYNAQVQAFTARLEGFKALVQAFEAQMRGVEVYIEQLKAQIAFEQTKAEINTSLVNQYKVEVDAALATLEIYKAQVQIIETQANIEKVKVDVYGAQIQAYTGQINAYTAQVEGYKASIEAQATIESAYKTSVDAYTAEVNAGVAVVDARVAAFKGQIDGYMAQIEQYKAQIAAMSAQAQASSYYNTSLVEAFKGEVSAVAAYNEAMTQQYIAIINEQEKIAEVGVKAAEANGQLYISTRGLALHATEVMAQVAGQMGAAALNTVHSSNTSNWNLSTSLVQSVSDSTSDSTSHNYNQAV